MFSIYNTKNSLNSSNCLIELRKKEKHSYLKCKIQHKVVTHLPFLMFIRSTILYRTQSRVWKHKPFINRSQRTHKSRISGWTSNRSSLIVWGRLGLSNLRIELISCAVCGLIKSSIKILTSQLQQSVLFSKFLLPL